MRDPAGRLASYGDQMVRTLSEQLSPDHFLYGAVARRLVGEGKLVDFSFSKSNEIISPKLGFVSFPSEWVNEQLLDAAKFTLELCRQLKDDNWELKDASAWNVLFYGCKPVFCDHLSFQRITTRQWYSFGQFVRHFIFPLYLARHRNLSIADAFKIRRDGLSPEYVKSIFGLRRFFTPIWPLMISSGSSFRLSESRSVSRTYHSQLFQLLDWMLKNILTDRKKSDHWRNYTSERDHYSADALRMKKEVIHRWLFQINPRWVLDLGSNTGEFSLIAADLGANVVAVESDHDALEALYLSSVSKSTIYPILTDLGDAGGGRGWACSEFPSLFERLLNRFDASMMLALIHHLAISESIPYIDIAKFLHGTTKRYAIVELIREDDPQVMRLLIARGRTPHEFTIDNQLNAFFKYFRKIDSVILSCGLRQLILLEKI
jgi:hypothetical protein